MFYIKVLKTLKINSLSTNLKLSHKGKKPSLCICMSETEPLVTAWGWPFSQEPPGLPGAERLPFSPLYLPVDGGGHPLLRSQLERDDDPEDLIEVPARGGWVQDRQLQFLIRTKNKHLQNTQTQKEDEFVRCFWYLSLFENSSSVTENVQGRRDKTKNSQTSRMIYQTWSRGPESKILFFSMSFFFKRLIFFFSHSWHTILYQF